MNARQAEFAAAVMDPARAVPEGLTDPAGRPAGKRFDVYRNNVIVSLIKGLEAAFPALATALGAENFGKLASFYVRARPPASPLMMRFGGELPAFLESFAPLAAYPWLPDLARLELALRESYHAADAPPVPQAALAALPPERLLAARLGLAPALRLLRSRWPVLSLWRQQMEGAPAPARNAPGEAVLITRPEYDPLARLLPPGGATFVLALQERRPLGAAQDAAAAAVPGFDPATTLALLIGGGAITTIEEEP
jgi:hypothetical protein